MDAMRDSHNTYIVLSIYETNILRTALETEIKRLRAIECAIIRAGHPIVADAVNAQVDEHRTLQAQLGERITKAEEHARQQGDI